MKKKALLLLVVCTLAAGLLFTGTIPGHAAGMSVGVTTWYWTWNITPEKSREYDPGLMFGPILGFDWGKQWSLASVFLTGDYKMDQEIVGLSWTGHPRRYDSDTTLNYSVLRWLKVFGGFKYMRYDAALESGETISVFEASDFKHYSYGPGLGIGLTLPVSDSLFALINVSGMYLSGKESFKGMSDTDIIETGINTAASLAYYVASISTTFSAGVRCQYFVTQYREPEMPSDKSTFYGVTFSAVYHFGLGSEE